MEFEIRSVQLPEASPDKQADLKAWG